VTRVARFAQVMLDGVTYVAARHEPVVELVELAAADEPSARVAEEALRATLARLGGVEARLRAGFAAVRVLDHEPDQASGAPECAPQSAPKCAPKSAWIGPAHLFAFEARVAGAFEVTYAGEDGSDWPPPTFGGDEG
jgi:hypothetical protein